MDQYIKDLIEDDTQAEELIAYLRQLIDKAYLMGCINGGSTDIVSHLPQEINRLKSLGYDRPCDAVISLTE